jgi:protein-S-isoprenylcysteine O-methyltransferase Ste14
MKIYTVLLILLPTLWFAFEVGLVIRDGKLNQGKTTIDHGTMNYNFLAMLLGFIGAALVNELSRFFFPGGRSVGVFVLGILLMLAGLLLRIWAVITLGKSFRTTIETSQEQKVIRSGPYRLIRHPSYTGLLVFCLGYGVALQNWLSLIIVVLLPLAALLYRIRIEEAALASSFGEDYLEYQKHSKRLIPWIW